MTTIQPHAMRFAVLALAVTLAAPLTAAAAQGDAVAEPHPDYHKALELLRGGQPAEAETLLEALVEREPRIAPYHHLLAVAHLANGKEMAGWTSARTAARLAPKHPPSASLLMRMWNVYDKQGLFDVGASHEPVLKQLGEPDQQAVAGRMERWVYGFFSVDFVNGKVYATSDLRTGGQPVPPRTDRCVFRFDDRDWRVGHRFRSITQNNTEHVLPGETVHDYTELYSLQRMVGMANRDISARKFMNLMMKRLKETVPGAEWKVLRDGEDDILYEWSVPKSDEHPAQHEISRLMTGDNDIYRLAYVQRQAKMPDEDRAAWIDRLEKARIEPLDSEAEDVE